MPRSKKDFSTYNIQNERPGDLFSRQCVLDTVTKKSEFIVADGYVAFVLRDGVRQETIRSGRHQLFGRKGVFGKIDVKRMGGFNIIFVSNNTSKNIVPWGIPSKEMEMKDPLTGVDFSMASHGEMTIRVANPEKFYEEWLVNKPEGFSVLDFQTLALTKIKIKVREAILKTIREQDIPYHRVDERTNDIARGVLKILQNEFATHFGINVADFGIIKITIPQDRKEEMMKKYDTARAKREEKDDIRETLDMLERMQDREWEKEKFLIELKARNYDKYLQVCRAIGWEGTAQTKAKGKAENVKAGGFCNKCGKMFAEGCEFCSGCGNRVSAQACKCGNILAPGAMFCNKCGTNVGNIKEETK
ncbi:MAG: SPFH domain-containing protein [Firmicutes bacterium]|nr:SPFH domain-containing protein [Bacillota bacterium]